MYETRETAARAAHRSARPTTPGDRPGGPDGHGQAQPPGSLAGAVAAVTTAVDALAGVDVAGAGGREVLDAAVALQRAGDRLAGVRFGVLAEADGRRDFVADGAVALAAWYRNRANIDHTDAARQVRTGARLRQLPALAAALAEGAVTAAHAMVVADAAIPRRLAAVAAVEDFLVELAQTEPPTVLRRAVARIRDAADPDGSDVPPLDESGPDERRELWLAYTGGLWNLRAALDVLTGEKLAGLLDAFETPDPPDTPAPQRRSAAQRRHDAFDALLDRLTALADTPTVGGAGAHILAGIDLGELLGDTPLARDPDALAALLADPDTTPEQLHALLNPTAPSHDDPTSGDGGRAEPATPDTPGGAPHSGRGGARAPLRPPPPQPWLRYAGAVPAAVIRRLAHQAKITAVLRLGPWRVVNVGRAHRSLPAWLRTVLHIAHGHCRGPDCDRPVTWTQAHHGDGDWADGADTDLTTSVPLCHAHHDLVTTGGWTLAYNPHTGTCTWTSPHGQVIHTHPRNR